MIWGVYFKKIIFTLVLDVECIYESIYKDFIKNTIKRENYWHFKCLMKISNCQISIKKNKHMHEKYDVSNLSRFSELSNSVLWTSVL